MRYLFLLISNKFVRFFVWKKLPQDGEHYIFQAETEFQKHWQMKLFSHVDTKIEFISPIARSLSSMGIHF